MNTCDTKRTSQTIRRSFNDLVVALSIVYHFLFDLHSSDSDGLTNQIYLLSGQVFTSKILIIGDID